MAQFINDVKVRPIVDDEIVVKLVKKLYGLNVKNIRELNGYDDKNYWIHCDDTNDNVYINKISADGYVLKIINSLDSKDTKFIEGQNEMMLYLNQRDINCSVPVMNLMGSYYSVEKIREMDNTTHIVRLLVFCRGEILCNAKLSSELLFNVGLFVAKLDNTLKGFFHSSYENRVHLWSLMSVPKLRDYIYVIDNDKDKSIVIDVINKFESDILTNLDKLNKGMIHGDINEQNIIVNDEQTNVLGIIDFGDTQYSYLIFELALTLFYMIMQARDIEMGKYVIAGFQSVNKLSNFEKKIIKTAVCARACQSLVLGIYSHLNEPDNNYLMITQESGWKILRKLWPMSEETILNIWEL
ncbi:hypothetical protein PV325_001883 [Microctonus aethiopoides]|nr:hypothetical protein PV325_001883 [Microctonus aethiopoides]KAK0083378.1 hypothetical protein PV326_006751 [Microctonus aethiopoides]